MQRFAVTVVLAFSISLTGCFSRKLGFAPAAPPELSNQVSSSLLSGDWLANYNSQIHTGKCTDQSLPDKATHFCGNQTITYADDMRALRNSYIDAIRNKIDRNYDNFRTNVYSGNAVYGFISDLAVLGLSGAGALIDDTALKSILAVATGGVTGASASYQKQILSQQSTFTIVSAMDALRATKETAIIQSELREVSDYTMESALIDLRQYYYDGNILNGLLYLQGQTQQTKQLAQLCTQKTQNAQKLVPCETAPPANLAIPNPATQPDTGPQPIAAP